MKRECETCVRNKLIYCPSSVDCLATDDKPYYQNKIMILEENWKLKKQLEEKENQQKEFIGYLENEINTLTQGKETFAELDTGQAVPLMTLAIALEKYKEIIGGKDETH